MRRIFLGIAVCLIAGLPRLHAQQFYVSETLKRAIDAAITEDKGLANHDLEIQKLTLERKGVLNK